MLIRQGYLVTPENETLFFKFCTPGHVYTYDEDYYLWEDIKKAAEYHGVPIEYCRPGSPEYKTYGCFAFKVLEDTSKTKMRKSEILKEEKFKFNVDNLVLN